MKRVWFGLLLVAGLLVFGATGVVAQTPPGSLTQQCADQMRPGDDPFSYSCTWDEKGNLVVNRGRGEFGSSGFGGMFGMFVVLALLWAAVPLVIAVGMAKNRGDSATTPVLYTLAGGWLGLALYHATTRNRITGEAAPLSDAVATSVRPRDMKERLRALDDLLAAGAITAEEHHSRRASILQEI